MDQAIVAVTDGNWQPTEGTVLQKAGCTLTVNRNGHPTNAFFYVYEASPQALTELQSNHQILGTIPLGSAMGAEGRASRAGTPT
jgi:hypothetical protein